MKRLPKRNVKPNLESLEDRMCPASVDLLWSPSFGSTLASDGNNWYDTETRTWGTGPLQAPGANVYLGTQSTSPIVWDTGGQSAAVYATNIFTVESNYNAEQEIQKGVSINTGSVSCPGLLNLTFDGPTDDPTNGSYFYINSSINTISDMALDGPPMLARSGNFVISSSAVLTLAQGATLPDQRVSNTAVDVYGSLTLNNGKSPLTMEQSSWLRVFKGGQLTMDDRNGTVGIVFIDSDNSNNMLMAYSQASVNVDCYSNVGQDVIKVGIVDMGNMDVEGDGVGSTLALTGVVNPVYAPGYAIDVIPQSTGSKAASSSPTPLITTVTNATLTLLDKVTLYCPKGYYQEGISSTLMASLSTDDSGNTINTSSSFRSVIGTNSCVQFFDDPGTFGQLSFMGNGVDFNGTLLVNVDRGSANCDSIYVKTGNIVFGAASILPQLTGSGGQTSWQVFLDEADAWFGWSNVSLPSGWTLGSPGDIND